jgi:predicted phosphodiesterase
MAERILILSDLHLGRPDAVRAAVELAPLLDAADRIVLNGDTAELHHRRWRDAAARELDSLRNLVARRGTALTLLAGNHDPCIAAERTLLLCDGALLVTHGDAFHPAVAPWSIRADAMRAAWESAMAGVPPEDRRTLAARLAAVDAAARAEWEGPVPDHTRVRDLLLRPFAALRILHYWRSAPRLAAAFLRDTMPHVRTVVTGHSHWPGIATADGRTVVNTGAFGRPNTPHAALLEGRNLALHRIRRRNGAYRLDTAPRQTCAVAGTNGPALASRDGSGRPSAAEAMLPASSSAATSMPVVQPEPSQA